MSNLTIFNFEHSQIQTIIENNEIFFRATQLAELLEYSNPHKAIKDHVDPDDLTKREVIDTIRRKQRVLFVNESGMYSLVLGSKLPSAKKVKRWVTSEVLPQIRKTGKYSLQNQQLALPEPEKTFSTELTEYELQTLVWLWIAVSEQQQLIEHLNPALQQLGSSLAPTAHSLVAEFRHIVADANQLLNKLTQDIPLEPRKDNNWTRSLPRLRQFADKQKRPQLHNNF